MNRFLVLAASWLFAVSSFAEIPLENAEDKRAEDLLKKGDLRYDVKEYDEAIEIFKNVIDRFPKSKWRYTARLRLGKHFYDEKQYSDAIGHLYKCAEGSEISQEQAESLYLIGVSYYQQSQFQKCFSELRRVTANFPGTEYCNKAYHYIGMAHFQLKHYKRAIEAFRMVGTSVDDNAENVKKLSPGKRLFVKVNDRDLTILSRQKKTLKVEVKTKTGDIEQIELHSRGITGTDFIGSIKTELGEPRPNDESVQVIGTDEITVSYIDTHASKRKRDVLRLHQVKMADDARVDIVDGIFKNRVQGVALDRNANFRVIDYDRDLGAAQDQVKIIVRSKREIKEEAGKIVKEEDLIARAKEGKEKKYEILDEETIIIKERTKEELRSVEMPLKAKDEVEKPKGVNTEAGETKAEAAPEAVDKVHSGIFIGSIPVRQGEIKKGDLIIQAEMNDLIEVEYVDEVRVTGDTKETHKAEVVVVKGQLSIPIPYESVIRDASLRVKTEMQVSEALMHMGRIYKELGLKEQADAKFIEALKECGKVAREKGAYNRELLEKTQYLLWKIYFEKGDHQAAAQVCLNLLRNFPNSEFADDALMMMGNVAKEKEEYQSAISYYSRLLQVAGARPKGKGKKKETQVAKSATSPLAPDAQYYIAECYELMGDKNKSYFEKALMQYKKCAELYPMSNYAPKAITKIANFYYQMKDYARALEIYDKTLRDYADADFIDLILLNYGKCMVMMKDYSGAASKFQQVIEEHPESKYVKKAKKYLKYVLKKAKKASAAAG